MNKDSDKNNENQVKPVRLSFRESMAREDGELMAKLGTQVTLWGFDCDRDMIDDVDRLAGEMEKYVKQNKLTLKDKCCSKFEPQGVTVVLVLQESHLLLNTWPEHGVLQIELFSCTDVDTDSLSEIARNVFGAKRVYLYNLE